MKLLTATKEGQGGRKNDFNFCKEGEIVMFGMECDGEEIDGNCGCRRAMVGEDSMTATTTMKVREMKITQEALEEIIRERYRKGGWLEGFDNRADEIIKNEATRLVNTALVFNIGDIVEKRGETFQVRKINV